MTAQEAQQEFAALVQSQRDTALWFLRDDVSVSITQPEAATILESIARVASRSTWLQIRRLKAWRSQHCS